MINRQIDVLLGDRSYQIYLGNDMIESLAKICLQSNISKSLIIITDKNVAKFYLKNIVSYLKKEKFVVTTIVIPPGEEQKCLSRLNSIYTELLKNKITRNSTILAFGGGVIGDLAGFAAATYQRGIKLIQVPTTLLAQVDSSIGGKVGINHTLGKNMIGAFYQPQFVWMDTVYLKSLPLREIICGIGEVIKYGIIRDANLFSFLESNIESVISLDTEAIKYVQGQCASIKAEIVSQDEKESDVRIILNFGHTIGHGLESAGKYKILKHGEAVLLGMIAESYISYKVNLLSKNNFERICNLIRRVPINVQSKSLKIKNITNSMLHDKKRISNKDRFVLPANIGNVEVIENPSKQVIESAIKFAINGKW